MKRASTRYWCGISALILPTVMLAVPPREAAGKKVPRRANELTLAGLRPGRSTLVQAMRRFTQSTRKAGDPALRAEQIYGKPDSLSPSTKNGEPLELLYYAFDWAGPNVPQVMEAVRTPDEGGKPGHVVEITLAASSL